MDKDIFNDPMLKMLISFQVANLIADLEAKLKEMGVDIEIEVKNVDFNKIIANAKEVEARKAKAEEHKNDINIFSSELDEYWKRRNE